MNATASIMIEPLIKRHIFRNEEEALRELLRSYILQQITDLQQRIETFTHKYGMNFQQFQEYLHERSVLLQKGDLSQEQRQTLGRAVMQEEDDWFDWKTATEMLESWFGIRQEMTP